MRSIIFSVCISMVLLVTNSCSGLPQELTETEKADLLANWSDSAARAELAAEWAVMAETEGTEKLPEGPAAHAVADLAAHVAATSRGASQRAAERAALAVALVPRWEPLRAESVAADLAVADLAAHVAQLEASELELWHRWAAQFVRSREF